MSGVIQEVRARFSATAQGLMNSIRDMREGVQDFGSESTEAMRDTNRGLNSVQDTLQDVENNVENMADAMHQAGNAAHDMGNAVVSEMSDAERMANAAESGMSKFRQTFLTWTAAAAGVTLITTGMGALVAVTDQYQQALNHLTAQTGATEAETAALGQSMQNIYAEGYGQDFQDIAQSMADVEKATNLTGEALERATKKAITLRDTFGYEVAESTKVADTMMRQFGITADEAFELIAQGSQGGLDKSGDMLDSFNEYSVYFKQLGFDAEGMWNVFKAGSESGAFNADKVGDAIKELGIRVKDGSKTTADGFATLGLNADEMAQKFAAGGDSAQEALGQVFTALADIEDPIARNAAGVSLFGTQFEDLEYETIAALGTVRNEANMTGDVMNRMNEVKFDSIGQAIQGIGRQILVSLINPMQEKVMPVVNNMVGLFKQNLPQIQAAFLNMFNVISSLFASLAPIFENVFGILKNVAPAILTPLGLAFKGLTNFITPVIDYITNLIEKFTGLEYFAPILGGIISGFVAYQVGVKLAAAAQAAWALITNAHIIVMNAMRAAVLLLNSAWLANPIVLIVALLVGLGVALYMAWQKSETFREIVTKAWEAIKIGAQAVFNWFTVTLPAWIASVVQWFKNMGTQISTFFSNLWASVVAAWNSFKDTVVNIVSAFVEVVGGFFNNLANNIKYIIEPFMNFIVQSWQNMKDLVLGIVGVFTGLLTGDMEAVKNALTLIWLTIKDQIINFVTMIKDTALRIWEIMKSGLLVIGNAIKDAAINAWNALKTGVVNAATALKDGAVNAWNNLKSSIVNMAESIKSSVVNGFNSAKESAVNTWNNMVNAVREGVTNAVNKVVEMKNSIISTAKGIDLYQIGKDIVQGLVNGLANMLGSLKKKAKEIADTVKEAIADKLKIKSPSRVMMGFGVNVGEGLRNGIDSMIKSVGKVAGGMADAVTDNMGIDGALDGALSTSATVTSLTTIKHAIDLLNVPEGIDENSLVDMLSKLVGNPKFQKTIDRVNYKNNFGAKMPLGRA